MIKKIVISFIFILLLLLVSLACAPSPKPTPSPTPTPTPAVTPTPPEPLSMSRSLDKMTVELGGSLKATLNYKVADTFTGLIVIEKVPLGWGITASKPEVNVFDPSTGTAKWVLKSRKGIESGLITYTAKAGGEAGEKRISGEWKAIDIEGEIHKGSIPELRVTIKR